MDLLFQFYIFLGVDVFECFYLYLFIIKMFISKSILYSNNEVSRDPKPSQFDFN